MDEQFEGYIASLFATEDDALKHIQSETARHDMPSISINPQDGALLHWLVRSIGAKRAVEIGTLGGYSGTWIARALPEDGKLYTVEVSSKHAQVARANFDHAGVGDRVEVLQGQGREVLAKLKGPFDFAFIDANKDEYPFYLDWVTENLRPGGMLTAHNAYRGGNVLDPQDENDHIMRDFLATIAADDRLHGMVIPMGDGMAVALRR